MPPDSAAGSTLDSAHPARDLVGVVLVEAVGSSITPFVPLPFVDDYLFARLLRRIARKVLVRHGHEFADALVKSVVQGYAKAGDAPLGEKAVVAAARFVLRKVAVVLDVKKSHDVFGEAIAFALALDIAREHVALHDRNAGAVGSALYRAVRAVGSGPIEVLAVAAKSAFTTAATDASRYARISEAVGQRVDETRRLLVDVVRYELAAARG